MRQPKPRRVQEHAFQSSPLQVAVNAKVAVFVIAGQRKTEMCQMHAYLVGTAGL